MRVNIISPGAIATPIFWGGHTNGQQISAEHAEARMAKYSRMAAKALPLAPSDGHGGESRDIALAAVYLGSDESRWVTGIDLLVVSPDSARKTLVLSTVRSEPMSVCPQDGGMDAVKGEHTALAEAQREMWAARDAAQASKL